MNKHDADKIIGEYTGKLYGFAMSKLGNPEEAEELAAVTVSQVYEVLLRRDNIVNINSYIYKIAHNVWVRYIGGKIRTHNIDGIESVPDEKDFAEEFQQSEMYGIVRREIAYLSKIQREIVVRHYYRQEKVKAIAAAMDIPEGTVKWHLACTRKELRSGMDKIRTIGNLGVNPIRLTNMGHNGHPGELGDTSVFLAKVITQNIAYAAYHKPMTINEIAEELGINPIFVEDEVRVLEEYGFMDKLPGDKYRTNIWIYIPSEESSNIYKEIEQKYAEIFSEKFFIPYFESIKEIPDFLDVPDNDMNLLRWSMIPFLSHKLSTAEINDRKYSVKRKDGGDYVAFANLDMSESSRKGEKEENIYRYCGDMWRDNCYNAQVPFSWDNRPSRWSSWRLDVYWNGLSGWVDNTAEDYDKLYFFLNGQLEENEANVYAYKRLLDRGYLVKKDQGYKTNIILSYSAEKWFELFPEANDEINKLSKQYAERAAEAELLNQPEHMHELIRYYTQNSACDLHTRIMKYLLDKGVLKLPTEEQRRGLCTVMFLGE
ncbi:MAG: RNA polymerase sigma factor [Oscillospiraceae bacterium]|nr:RNA polymerase sigma factor [Oscillospiraceae bacterium]